MKWDAHACLVVHPDEDFTRISQFSDWGYNFVSVNVGMDVVSNKQIMATILSFRSQIADNADKYLLVKNTNDVENAKRDGKLAIAFDLEGGVCLEGNPDKVQQFYDLGVRQIHLAYNADNDLCGGCHGDDIGLTDTGRIIVDRIHDVGMFMDISHTGYRSSLDIMNHGGGPVIYSHANPMGDDKHPRTIDRLQAQTCVSTGGIIGVTGHAAFINDPQGRSETVANQIDTLVDWVGVDNVGLGWDYMFDNPHDLEELSDDLNKVDFWPVGYGYGATTVEARRHANPGQTDEVMVILQERGYSTSDITKILGLNFFRLAKSVWK